VSRQKNNALTSFFSGLILHSPARISIIAFALLMLSGAMLLLLPAASTGGAIGFADALFTATSAGCVTGLAVFDIVTRLTWFGQIVILILIQLGGLGIMTLSTLFLLLAGRRLSLTGRIVIQDTFTHSKEQSPSSIVFDVMLFALLIEGLGALILFFRFVPKFGAAEALHLSIFHSVSAFCNAGFAMFSESFVSYCEDWVINLTLSFLIISGGIGFPVLSELKHRFSFRHRRWSRLSLHSKLVLSSTAILLMLGTLMILLTEWRNTLAPLSFSGRVLAAFFQSVSARTAGFNTLPIGEMTDGTLFFIIVLMFIGASPGSCGGGVKTTTAGSLILLGISRVFGHARPRIFHRSIPESDIWKSLSLVMVSMFVISLGVIFLLMTEVGQVSHFQSRGKFLEILFETVSAFGTVGLSTGITPHLSTAGKLIITFIMFIGRLGPLVIGIAISRQKISRYSYAEENIMVG
jgi:trk system potassium uptake protein TrkH